MLGTGRENKLKSYHLENELQKFSEFSCFFCFGIRIHMINGSNDHFCLNFFSKLELMEHLEDHRSQQEDMKGASNIVGVWLDCLVKVLVFCTTVRLQANH